ncbi:hypothetical protein FI615_001692 [Enterococcus faecium]|mgnify:CR=1 FL=1|uniref:hypothetical protein n=1 Tax=Enterococcus faecium TaxID=1352 RepID=UPI001924D0D9|nr:hypothetical protein [Enterococcus faecium]EGP4894205.1 hypothetical protein [Enterococcus faecium]EHK9936761.1 hypothetical protein [Enterococcus faecium]MBL3708353.1 hypothetical protein [Enterococcus faecium]
MRLTYPNGHQAVSIDEFDKLQKDNLEHIKFHGVENENLRGMSVYIPEQRFKNVTRENKDGTVDIIIDQIMVEAMPSGFLPKPFYQALRMRKVTDKKLFTGEKVVWEYVDILQVSERDILSSFSSNLPIEAIEAILLTIQSKGVNYYV